MGVEIAYLSEENCLEGFLFEDLYSSDLCFSEGLFRAYTRQIYHALSKI